MKNYYINIYPDDAFKHETLKDAAEELLDFPKLRQTYMHTLYNEGGDIGITDVESIAQTLEQEYEDAKDHISTERGIVREI
jgi:hypothetical protein